MVPVVGPGSTGHTGPEGPFGGNVIGDTINSNVSEISSKTSEMRPSGSKTAALVLVFVLVVRP